MVIYMLIMNWLAVGFMALGLLLSCLFYPATLNPWSNQSPNHQQLAIAVAFAFLIDIIYRLELYTPFMKKKVAEEAAAQQEAATQSATPAGPVWWFRLLWPRAGGHVFFIPLWACCIGLGCYYWANP